MVREIENAAGIPVVQIATIVPIMMTVGTNRIVPGVAIPHPVGDPEAGPEGQAESAEGQEVNTHKKTLKLRSPPVFLSVREPVAALGTASPGQTGMHADMVMLLIGLWANEKGRSGNPHRPIR